MRSRAVRAQVNILYQQEKGKRRENQVNQNIMY